MSSEKSLPKKSFRSKTALTICGYCSQKIKQENLENHCRTVHKKPKLAAGQSTLDHLFSRPGGSLPLVEPDPTPPPSKKVKLSDEDGPVLEEADPRVYGDHILLDKVTEATVEDVYDDNSESGNVEMTPGNKVDENNCNKPSFVETDVAPVSISKLDEIVIKIDAIKASVDSTSKRSVPEFARPSDTVPDDGRVDHLVLCKTLDDILEHFSELSYSEEDEYLKCDLCCDKSSQ